LVSSRYVSGVSMWMLRAELELAGVGWGRWEYVWVGEGVSRRWGGVVWLRLLVCAVGV
jgi:hypothetical protein